MKHITAYLIMALSLALGTPIYAQKQDVAACDSDATDIFGHAYPDLINNNKIWIPFFAVKTNLLFDAASLLNVGVEVPLGYRWSVAADYYFPWWKNSARNLTVQSLAGVLEVRRWLGRRIDKPVMSGFYGGLYVGAGYYDFQLGGDGIQGEFFLMGGLSLGYTHKIGKNLMLEYNLGVGYLRTTYREYSPVNSSQFGDIKAREYPWPERRQTWIGPTKAQVSLQWLINGNTFRKKKGGRK